MNDTARSTLTDLGREMSPQEMDQVVGGCFHGGWNLGRALPSPRIVICPGPPSPGRVFRRRRRIKCPVGSGSGNGNPHHVRPQ